MRTHPALRTVQYAIACLFTVTSLYPIFLMVASSFKNNLDIFREPFALPKSLDFSSYAKIFEDMPFLQYSKNSILVSAAVCLIVLLFGSMASFYIARFRFWWNNALFMFFLLGMMIPIKLGIVPLFLQMKKMGIIDSLGSLIMVYSAMGIPMAVLIMSAFFRTLPKELEEAAKIDGATNAGILLRIVIPLMRPALGTVLIFNFITAWNDFFFPLVFITDEMKKTIPVGMLSLFSQYSTNWNMVFAGLTLSSIPMIIIFFFASRQFMEGLTAGAVK
ncbi:carbohydrate ABC transporter permease [Cohnella faecalis]|uniref:Carbohydrate ABC transporter permease n=1 Tax=Cohnella faecalis TaxID=2315694 RepID=A0A398CFD1_9BACL|nr:carbohydrate ABC transporter permease [Cohnella faecalis]RIE01280.1 carbohydrate ABC transporter permease [Cohnella faecalis]